MPQAGEQESICEVESSPGMSGTPAKLGMYGNCETTDNTDERSLLMKFWPVFLCLLLSLSHINAAGTKRTGFTVPAKYEGGTLSLNQSKIRATFAEDEVIIVQANRRFAIPIGNITAISSGTDIRRRFGAYVLGMVPLVHLDKVEAYYVGLTWTGADTEGSSKVEAVLKLNGSEYRDVLGALERLTGIKAVNAGKVPTVVDYTL
jgi:hypothetical protein